MAAATARLGIVLLPASLEASGEPCHEPDMVGLAWPDIADSPAVFRQLPVPLTGPATEGSHEVAGAR